MQYEVVVKSANLVIKSGGVNNQQSFVPKIHSCILILFVFPHPVEGVDLL